MAADHRHPQPPEVLAHRLGAQPGLTGRRAPQAPGKPKRTRDHDPIPPPLSAPTRIHSRRPPPPPRTNPLGDSLYTGSFVQSPPSDRVAMHVSLARPGRPRHCPTQPQLTFPGDASPLFERHPRFPSVVDG